MIFGNDCWAVTNDWRFFAPSLGQPLQKLNRVPSSLLWDLNDTEDSPDISAVHSGVAFLSNSSSSR